MMMDIQQSKYLKTMTAEDLGELELRVIDNRMVVRIYENPFKKHTKIIGAENDGIQDGYFFAKVLGIGDAVTRIKAGDYIFFAKMAGVPISYYGQQYVVIREHDAIVVFENKNVIEED